MITFQCNKSKFHLKKNKSWNVVFIFMWEAPSTFRKKCNLTDFWFMQDGPRIGD